MNCPFCNPEDIVFENSLAYAKMDAFPVSPGHMLIFPKRHVPDFFFLNDEEKSAIFLLLDEAKLYLDTKYHPDGYNIGINCGEAAGQTIFHVHIHLIPRYKGDVPNPRGGVRGIIADKRDYPQPE